MSQSGSKNKVANSLVVMSSAAILAVYAAGYTRTRPAAHQLDAQAAGRRPAAPAPARTDSPIAEPVPIPPAPTSAVPEAVAAPAPVASARHFPAAAALPAPSVIPAAASPAVPAATPVSGPSAEAAAPAVEPKPEVAAPAPPPPAPTPPSAAATPVLKDGTYLGWGSSRHGDIQAAVVITGGRIESATIAQCRTRYSCSVIETLPPEVAQRQSPDVDTVSGATQSADAFYYAVVDALKQAK